MCGCASFFIINFTINNADSSVSVRFVLIYISLKSNNLVFKFTKSIVISSSVTLKGSISSSEFRANSATVSCSSLEVSQHRASEVSVISNRCSQFIQSIQCFWCTINKVGNSSSDVSSHFGLKSRFKSSISSFICRIKSRNCRSSSSDFDVDLRIQSSLSNFSTTFFSHNSSSIYSFSSLCTSSFSSDSSISVRFVLIYISLNSCNSIQHSCVFSIDCNTTSSSFCCNSISVCLFSSTSCRGFSS